MKILIVVAHPDDEVLGAGGTLLKHKQAGDGIYIHILTDGESSRGGLDGSDKLSDHSIKKRRSAAEQVASEVGAAGFLVDKFDDQKLDSYPHIEIVRAIEKFSEKIFPDIVYTHFGGDLNKDHRITHSAVITAFRPVISESPSKILSFETLSSTEWGIYNFQPNYFIDISDSLEKKKELVSLYGSEIKDSPHALSIENIVYTARKWGASIHTDAAEAFSLIREIRK